MVMVWLEGGQGEVRGACPPPPHPKLPHLDPPPNSPHLHPPPKPLLAPPPPPPPPIRPSLTPPSHPPPPPPPPPPQEAPGQQLVGGVVGVHNRGVAPPGPPPILGTLQPLWTLYLCTCMLRSVSMLAHSLREDHSDMQ